MEQRISFVTLAVRDVLTSRAFYVDGLRWVPELDVPGEVLMFSAGERIVLSLWDRAAFEAEVGGATLSGDGLVPVTLAHNVATPAEVRAVLDLARAAGAEVTGPVPELSGLMGVHDVSVDGQSVSCTVDPEGLPLVLEALTRAGVRTLTSTPPTLEELFLDAYRTPAMAVAEGAE